MSFNDNLDLFYRLIQLMCLSSLLLLFFGGRRFLGAGFCNADLSNALLCLFFFISSFFWEDFLGAVFSCHFIQEA